MRLLVTPRREAPLPLTTRSFQCALDHQLPIPAAPLAHSSMPGQLELVAESSASPASLRRLISSTEMGVYIRWSLMLQEQIEKQVQTLGRVQNLRSKLETENEQLSAAISGEAEPSLAASPVLEASREASRKTSLATPRLLAANAFDALMRDGCLNDQAVKRSLSSSTIGTATLPLPDDLDDMLYGDQPTDQSRTEDNLLADLLMTPKMNEDVRPRK